MNKGMTGGRSLLINFLRKMLLCLSSREREKKMKNKLSTHAAIEMTRMNSSCESEEQAFLSIAKIISTCALKFLAPFIAREMGRNFCRTFHDS